MPHAILESVVTTSHLPAAAAPRNAAARPLAANSVADAIRRDLTIIRTLAGAKEFQQARELCAVLLADQQPLIANHSDLLCETFFTLIIVRGFRLLSRLARSTLERDVRVTQRTSGARLPATLSQGLEHGRAVFIFDTGVDDSPLDESAARHWAEMIMTGATGDRIPTVAATA